MKPRIKYSAKDKWTYPEKLTVYSILMRFAGRRHEAALHTFVDGVLQPIRSVDALPEANATLARR